MTGSIWTSHPVTPARGDRAASAPVCGGVREPVSVVVTVRNEVVSIEPFLVSLLRQTRVPDEVVIADGGSTDGTRQRGPTDPRRRGTTPAVRVPGAPDP